MQNKILFVNPPFSGKTYEWIEQLGSKLPSIGLCSLAAYTREKGYQTDLLDAFNTGLTPEATLEKVLEFSPTHVGITAITSNVVFAGEFATLLKKNAPQIITIVGGPHITAMPEATMERFPAIDIGVLGEGEITIDEILGSPPKTTDLEAIKGIIYRDKEDKLKKNTPRPLIKDLDSLPFPAWDLLPGFPDFYRPTPTNFKKLPVASLVTSRGCPFACTFCDRSVFGRNFRTFSAEYIIKLIEDLHTKYGVLELCFYDDTFTADKKRLVTLCEYFIKKKLKLSWSCLGRVDNTEPQMLAMMKKAGCWLISYGIESASPEILEIYCKKTTRSQVENAITATKKAGITTRGFFIIGGPLETDHTVIQLKDMLKQIPLDDIHISFYTPIPGSELYDIADQYGTFSKDWTKMNVYVLNFIPNGLNGDKLLKYRADIYRSFYFHPKRIARYFILSLHPRRMKEILSRAWSFLKLLKKKR
ncbi:MAG: radical SAM protein [bacterium]|nr:radical SAM protein [bacterium]